MISTVSKGDVVEIHFLDHVEDGERALRFIVWGRIDRVYKKSLRIVSWAHEDPKDTQGSEHGTEKTFTIVKSAITKLSSLHRVPLDLPSSS